MKSIFHFGRVSDSLAMLVTLVYIHFALTGPFFALMAATWTPITQKKSPLPACSLL